MRWKSWLAGASLLLLGLTATAVGCGGEDVAANGENGEAEVERADVESMLPEGALVVVRGDDVEGFWTRLQGTRLYTRLVAIEDVQEAFGPMSETRREFEQETGLTLDTETIMTVFGDRFEMGFYGTTGGDDARVLLVADIEDRATAQDLVDALETKGAEERGVAFTDLDYQGASIRVGATAENDSLFYRLAEDRLFASSSQTYIEDALDLEADRGEVVTMADGERFADLVGRLGDSALVVYVDQESLRETAEETVSDTTGADPEERERLRAASLAFGDMQFSDAFAFGVRWGEKGILGQTITTVPEDSPSEISRMFTRAPGEVRSLSFQPAGTMLYGAINSLDARIIYEELKRYAIQATRAQLEVAGTADSLRADSLVNRNLEAFETETGIDVEEDLVAWIGDEAAFAIAGVDRTGFFPIPEAALTVAVTDRAKAEGFFRDLEGIVAATARDRASIPLQWQSEEYEGRTIRYAPTPMGEGLSVGYTVGDEFAIVTTSRGLAKRMLDARAGRADALPSNPDFGAMTDFYPQQANALGFADLESIFGEVQSLVGALGQMSGDASAADTTSTSHRVLEALKNAPRMGFYSTAEDDAVVGHFLVEIR